MSMSMDVIGIKPANEKFWKMKQVHDRCKELGIRMPDQVLEFFDYAKPDDDGVIVHLKEPCVTEFSSGDEEGIAVDLEKLPEGIKFLKFRCSY